MDEKMRRDIILDNYQNPANRGLPDDESYDRVNSKNDSCVDNIDVAAVKIQLNDNNEYTFNLLASNTYSFNNGIDSEIKKAMFIHCLLK